MLEIKIKIKERNSKYHVICTRDTYYIHNIVDDRYYLQYNNSRTEDKIAYRYFLEYDKRHGNIITEYDCDDISNIKY